MNGDHSDGFSTTRVAERERRGDRAGREDQRRVPRRERGDDADRLADPHRERARVRGDDLRRAARTRARPPAGRGPARTCIWNIPKPKLAPRLAGEQRDDLRRARLEQVGGLEEDPLALGRRRLRPRRRTRPRPPRSRGARRLRSPAGDLDTTSPVNGSRFSNVGRPPRSTHSPPTKSRVSMPASVWVLMRCSFPRAQRRSTGLATTPGSVTGAGPAGRPGTADEALAPPTVRAGRGSSVDGAQPTPNAHLLAGRGRRDESRDETPAEATPRSRIEDGEVSGHRYPRT